MDLIHKAVLRYRDKYNVTIREIKKSGGGVIIEISQGKTLDGNYFSQSELREIVKSLFASVHENFHIGAIPYIPLAHDIVNSKWLKIQLAENAMKIKSLANALGVNKKTLAKHHSGSGSMTNEERAMYFYYFKSIKGVKDEEE